MGTYMTEKQAAEAILDIGRRMYDKGMIASNDGNISIKIGDNEVLATPTGVSKGHMTQDMLVKMDLAGNQTGGTWKPSSEMKMHLGVYNNNPDVNAVMHAHPVVTTAFAIAGYHLDQPLITETIISIGSVKVAPYATPGTKEVPDSVIPYVKDYNAVMLSNHGILTWGAEAYQAYYYLEMIEHVAKTVMCANFIIGNVNPLSEAQIRALDDRRIAMNVKDAAVMHGDAEEVNRSEEHLQSMPLFMRK